MLVRTGQTVDILFDVTNPGLWMAHCHRQTMGYWTSSSSAAARPAWPWPGTWSGSTCGLWYWTLAPRDRAHLAVSLGAADPVHSRPVRRPARHAVSRPGRHRRWCCSTRSTRPTLISRTTCCCRSAATAFRRMPTAWIRAPEGGAPLVIITTNDERDLSRPFLRRCVVLALPAPESAGAGQYRQGAPRQRNRPRRPVQDRSGARRRHAARGGTAAPAGTEHG